MMTRTSWRLAFAAICAANCGCAGQYRTVQVSSLPPGATVRAGDGTTCVTPGTLRLRRNADQVLVASMAGHQTQLTMLRHKPVGSLETDKVHFEMTPEPAAAPLQGPAGSCPPQVPVSFAPAAGMPAGDMRADPRVAATGFPPPTDMGVEPARNALTSRVQQRAEGGASPLSDPALARPATPNGIQFQARVEQAPNDPLEPHRVPRPREPWDPLPLDFLPPGGVPMDSKARADLLQDTDGPKWSTRMSVDL